MTFRKLLTEMARDTRDKPGFQPKDDVDALLGAAYPNPRRVGCPGREAIQAAARKKLPIDHVAFDHLGQCSECYGEFRAFQQVAARSTWVRVAIAAAAVFTVVAIGGIYAGRTFDSSPWNGGTQSVVLDYRNDSVTRSESGEPARPARSLPRKNVDLTILPAIGFEPGSYDLRLVGNAGDVVFSKSVTGAMTDYVVRIKANLDLRSLPHGSYSLEIRRAGEDWDPHPVVIR